MRMSIFVMLIAMAELLSPNAGATLPGNFFQVSPGVFRSAQPSAADMQDLKRLGIKTIVDLNDDADSLAEERKAAKALGIRFIADPMSGFWKPKDAQVDLALAALKNPANYPILVHCLHGEDRTGLIVGLHRVFADGWQPAKAYDEMLVRGFHKILIFLNSYYKDRTGFDDLVEPQTRPASI